MAAISVPPDRRFVQVDVNELGFKVFFESPGTEFAAKAGLLEAAPRRFNVGGLHVVDPHDAGADLLHSAEGFEDVARPDGGGEAIGRVVSDADGVGFVVERNDAGDGSEDFFAGDAGGVVHVVKDGGRNVVALGEAGGAVTSGGELGFFPANLEVRAHAIILLLADQRAHLSFAPQRWAAPAAFRFFSHGFDELAVDGTLHEDATAGGADFALVDEDAEEGAVDSGFKVSIGEEDIRRLAAKFESYALHGVGGHLDDLLADGGASGEGDLVDVGMLHQGRASGFAEAGDDVYDAGRNAARREVLRKFKNCERRLLSWFQNASTSGSQRRSQLPCGHQQGIVPGNDLPGDADRLFQRKAKSVVGNGIDLAGDLGGESAVILETSGDVAEVILGFDNGLAAVAGFEFGEGSGVLADAVGQLEEHAAAPLRSAGGPRAIFEGVFGSSDGAVDVFRAAVGNFGDDLLGGRVVHVEGLAGFAGNPLAVDEHLVFLRGRSGSCAHRVSVKFAPEASGCGEDFRLP